MSYSKEGATDAFIYSKVRLCHTCRQMRSDYRDFPKDTVTDMRFLLGTNVKLTLKERWNPVTSVILFCTILLRFGVILLGLMCGGDSVFFFFRVNLHFSETRIRFRENCKWSHCACWWACCGALNGSPVDKTKTPKLATTTTNHQDATPDHRRFAKFIAIR